jgi:hypothetical protein
MDKDLYIYIYIYEIDGLVYIGDRVETYKRIDMYIYMCVHICKYVYIWIKIYVYI